MADLPKQAQAYLSVAAWAGAASPITSLMGWKDGHPRTP